MSSTSENTPFPGDYGRGDAYCPQEIWNPISPGCGTTPSDPKDSKDCCVPQKTMELGVSRDFKKQETAVLCTDVYVCSKTHLKGHWVDKESYLYEKPQDRNYC